MKLTISLETDIELYGEGGWGLGRIGIGVDAQFGRLRDI